MTYFQAFLGVIVGIIATLMAVWVVIRYFQSRFSRYLWWSAGLLLWALSAFCQSYALLLEWKPWIYKLYYFSAITLVGVLGAGTLGLIIGEQRTLEQQVVYYLYVGFILFFSVKLAFALYQAPVFVERLHERVIGGLALPSSVRQWSPWINIPGGVIFIGGAVYSFWKTKALYALFIVIGALIPALGGIFARFQLPYLLPFTDLLGILFLSWGVFLALKWK